MKKIIAAVIALCAFTLVGTPAGAQQTSGNIQGRIVDAQKAAIPGVTVTAKNTETGLTRSEVTDAEGVYRLNALPVGTLWKISTSPKSPPGRSSAAAGGTRGKPCWPSLSSVG